MAVSYLKYEEPQGLTFNLSRFKLERLGVVCFVKNENALDLLNNLCKVYHIPNVFMLNAGLGNTGRFNPLLGSHNTASDTLCEILQHPVGLNKDLLNTTRLIEAYMLLLKMNFNNGVTIKHVRQVIIDRDYCRFITQSLSNKGVSNEIISKLLNIVAITETMEIRDYLDHSLKSLDNLTPLKGHLFEHNFSQYTFNTYGFLQDGGALIVNTGANKETSDILERSIVFHLKNLIMEKPMFYKAPTQIYDLYEL